MNKSTKKEIEKLTYHLIKLAKKSCWNNFSDSIYYIFSEIINDEKNCYEKQLVRRKVNVKKKTLTLNETSEKLENLYSNLYDVNFCLYKATKNKTIIEIQYFLKSSLDKDYFEKVKDRPPMLHCKIATPIYLKSENEKFDVNWELGGLRYKWNIFWHKKKLKNKS